MDTLKLEFYLEISKADKLFKNQSVRNSDYDSDDTDFWAVRKSDYRSDVIELRNTSDCLRPFYDVSVPLFSLFDPHFVLEFLDLDSSVTFSSLSVDDICVISSFYSFAAKYLKSASAFDWNSIILHVFNKIDSDSMPYDCSNFEYKGTKYFYRVYIIPGFTRFEFDEFIKKS